MHALVEQFVEMLAAERGASVATLDAYRRDLDHWLSYLSAAPEQATDEDVRAFVQAMTAEGLAPTTAARRLSALRQFYKFLLSEQLIKENPTKLIDTPKHHKPLPKTLSEEEVDRLLLAAKEWPDKEGIRLLAMLELLYASGLRVSELVALPYSNVMRAMRAPKPVLNVTGKGGKERVVLLNQKALDALEAYMAVREEFLGEKKSSSLLFPSHGKQGHITRQRFGQLLGELAGRAGIERSKISPHKIRHAFATHLLRHGADLLSLQKLLGHADISTTQIYTHVLHEELAELVETYHPLARAFQE